MEGRRDKRSHERRTCILYTKSRKTNKERREKKMAKVQHGNSRTAECREKRNLLSIEEKVKRSQFALLLSTLIKHSLGYSFYSFRNLFSLLFFLSISIVFICRPRISRCFYSSLHSLAMNYSLSLQSCAGSRNYIVCCVRQKLEPLASNGANLYGLAMTTTDDK